MWVYGYSEQLLKPSNSITDIVILFLELLNPSHMNLVNFELVSKLVVGRNICLIFPC